MRVMTVLGTRPEIIRLSRIIPRLDACCRHILVHTGQNFDSRLSGIFFEELGLRQPCHFLGVDSAGFAPQVAHILERFDRVMETERPDRVLILGDTNSALSAIVAKRRGVPVFHMEAGNRCFDDRVPEELNRRLVDHASDVLMPYSERSRRNLLDEGIPSRRIFVVGNPIGEVITASRDAIAASRVLDSLGLREGGFFLATLHRAENVDHDGRRRLLFESLGQVSEAFDLPVVLSVHPRLADRLTGDPAVTDRRIVLHPPFGFHDFIRLEGAARGVLTDSGTVQEECAILQVPCVVLRDATERPEVVEYGGAVIVGAQPRSVLRGLARAVGVRAPRSAPPEYLRDDVADTVVDLVVAFHREFGG